MDIIKDYDIVVDGVDNFPTRYLLNDATVRLKIPVVSAAILGFEGQLSVFAPYEGPCYRCLFRQPPPAELAPSCGANGVLGVLPGTMGLLQSTEVVKLIIGEGDPLIGRLLIYDALGATTTELKVRRDPECPICSREPTRSPTTSSASSPTTRRSAPPRARVRHQLWQRSAFPRSCAPPSAASVRSTPTARPSARSSRAWPTAHPDTRGQLFGGDGELNRYVNVYLNDEDVRVLDGLTTPVGEGDSS